MGTNRSKSFEFTVYDEHGIEVSYNRDEKKLIFNGWYNYIQPMEGFEMSLEDFIKTLEIPLDAIKNAYDIDCFNKGKKIGRPKSKQKKKVKRLRVGKYFRNRQGDKKPSYDLVCQWHECGKTFNARHEKRKFCSNECSTASFTYRAKNGLLTESRLKNEAKKKLRKENKK